MAEDIELGGSSGSIPDKFYDDFQRQIPQHINAQSEDEQAIYPPQKTLSTNLVERILFSMKEQEVDFEEIDTIDFQVSFLTYGQF